MKNPRIQFSPVKPDWQGMLANLRRRGTPERVFYFEHGLTSGVMNAVCLVMLDEARKHNYQ